MARPTKLTDKRQKDIVKLLKSGVTIADTCAAVGIGTSTYYDWVRQGTEGASAFSEFSDAVSCAHNHAKVIAIGTIHRAAQPRIERSKTVKTYTETRLRKVFDQAIGAVTEEPYEYTEVTESITTTPMLGDWRAAETYLKRRFPDEWSERQEWTGKEGAALFSPDLLELLRQLGKEPSDAVRELEALLRQHAESEANR